MTFVRQIGRPVLGGCLAAIVTVVLFGLLLGLSWMPSAARDTTYKLVTTLLAAALAFTAGGYVAGRIVRRRTARAGLAFGLLFGLIACGYILGPHWYLLIAISLTAIAGAAGGRLARRPASTT